MSNYLRTTREQRLKLLPGEIKDALQQHQDRYNLGAIFDDDVMCIETVSVKKNKGLFKAAKGQQITSCAILTPTWLVYVVAGIDGEPAVLSVPLSEASVEDHASSPFYDRLPDTGFHVTGSFTGQVGMHGNQRVTIFLGLREERAARDFGAALMDGIAKTRR